MIRRTAVAIALTLAPAAFAQTYIVADGNCGAVTLHATHSADFPNLGETISADRAKQAYVFLERRRLAWEPAAGSRSLDFKANIPADGVAMASVDLTPEIIGNETRTEHAKALIFCAAIAPMADWQRSTGLGLEIFPQGWNGPRPRMKPGDKMRFIAVQSGSNWIRDLPMQLYRAGAGHVADGVPDKDGGMDFLFPEPGLYMVTTTFRRADPDQPQHWYVDTSTLTFEIK